MPKAKEGNIYDLVERAAARRAIPRLELWQSVAKALIEGELPASNLSTVMDPKVHPARTFRDWSVGFRASVDRFNDPSSRARILRHIIVRVSDFDRWLRRRKIRAKSGPGRDTTGFQDVDRKLFPRIRTMIKKGDAQSPYGAALRLVDEGIVADRGGGPDSKAKRLSARYRREC